MHRRVLKRVPIDFSPTKTLTWTIILPKIRTRFFAIFAFLLDQKWHFLFTVGDLIQHATLSPTRECTAKFLVDLNSFRGWNSLQTLLRFDFSMGSLICDKRVHIFRKFSGLSEKFRKIPLFYKKFCSQIFNITTNVLSFQ